MKKLIGLIIFLGIVTHGIANDDSYKKYEENAYESKTEYEEEYIPVIKKDKRYREKEEIYEKDINYKNNELSELKYKETLEEIAEVLERKSPELLRPEPAKVNISFYPLGMLLDCAIFGVEIPLNEKNAIEFKFGHYEFLDEKIGNKYEFRYRNYTHSGLRKAYSGVFTGYNDVNRKKGYEYDEDENYNSGIYAGLEFGYKMKFSDRFYMSNGINFGYSEAAGLLKNEDNNFFFGIDLFKMHVAF